ncbi:MAG: response regulator transcription factor [Elusimicrobiota bacterium]
MPRRILVVDDDPDMRQMLLCALDPLAEVSEAGDGPSALRKLRTLKPDLMLLDVAMPEMNGIAVLKAALAIDPRLVVVMLTGESDLATAKKTLDLGARTYITKPFDVEVVTGEVSRLLDGLAGGTPRAPYRPWRLAI